MPTRTQLLGPDFVCTAPTSTLDHCCPATTSASHRPDTQDSPETQQHHNGAHHDDSQGPAPRQDFPREVSPSSEPFAPSLSHPPLAPNKTKRSADLFLVCCDDACSTPRVSR